MIKEFTYEGKLCHVSGDVNEYRAEIERETREAVLREVEELTQLHASLSRYPSGKDLLFDLGELIARLRAGGGK